MSIIKHQEVRSYSAKRLRRARRLYMRLCYQAVMNCPDNAAMNTMTQKMHDRGLYADPAQIVWRDYRYRILRYMWRQDRSPGAHWFIWLRAKGFDHNFNKVSAVRIA